MCSFMFVGVRLVVGRAVEAQLIYHLCEAWSCTTEMSTIKNDFFNLGTKNTLLLKTRLLFY